MPVEMTRAKLDGYRKLVQEIPILECELRELWLTDKGMGKRRLFSDRRNRKVSWVLIMSDTIGGKNLCSGRKRKPEQSVNGSRQ